MPRYKIEITLPPVPEGYGIIGQVFLFNGETEYVLMANDLELEITVDDPGEYDYELNYYRDNGNEEAEDGPVREGTVIVEAAPEPLPPLPQPGEITYTVTVIPDEPTPIPPDPPAGTKKLIGPSNLKLIGGWRVPPTLRPDVSGSTAYTKGGLAVDGNKLYILHGEGVMEYVAPAMGTGTAYKQWPMLPENGTFRPDIYKPAVKANPLPAGQTNFIQPVGLAILNGKIHVSGRTTYASPPPEGPYICVDGDSKAYKPANTFAQQFGGGLCLISEEFAKTFLGNRATGIGFGGSTSGQGYTAGPSLVASSGIDDPNPITLVSFGPGNSAPASLREKRPPDYTLDPSVAAWGLIPPSNGVGYWCLDKVRCWTWVETATHHGLLYWTLQGTGKISYEYQDKSLTGGEVEKSRLYVYDPVEIAEVASGKRKPHQYNVQWHEWTGAGGVPCVPKQLGWSTMPGEPIGACWYANRLYVLHCWAWKDGGVEEYPVVGVYEVGE